MNTEPLPEDWTLSDPEPTIMVCATEEDAREFARENLIPERLTVREWAEKVIHPRD